MASSYFTLPSFARAKKNKDELEKAGVKDPVLSDDDEKFLARVASHDNDNNDSTKDLTKTRISEDGTATDTLKKSTDDVVIFPGKQPDKESDPSSSTGFSKPPATSTKAQKDSLNELPSQEEAEAATKHFQTGTQAQADKKNDKKSWASYIHSLPAKVKSSTASLKNDDDDRTWKEFASSYLPALPSSWTKSNDIKTEPVYRDDGSIDEEATKDKQEKEVSVLLDNLNLSSINNRVFSFSDESQKIYERFVQVLKDVLNGVPTAYEDMEKLMKDAGPTIEKQWNAMPPFVQTLVKALPAKLGATLGPEFLVAASEKPGFDAKTMNAANDKSGKSGTASSSKKGKKKRSFKIPGLKSLVKKQGLAATILRNIVVFFETRFPFLVTTTNVVMSLSVFVLMFVFYYCWKRGREVRLAKEHEANLQNSKLQPVDGSDDSDDDDEIEVEITDEDDDSDDTLKRAEADIARSIEQKTKVLEQKDPAQVALPTTPSTDKV